MNLFTITNLVAFDGGSATVDDFEMGIRVLDESFRISVIFGGVFVPFLLSWCFPFTSVCLLLSCER